jgi:hypothetical protein
MWWKRGKSGDVDAKALDELARALLVQEQSALRAEILASYGYAQSIVKWTLATFATILAASLVAVYNADKSGMRDVLLNIVLAIFALGLPGIVWMNAWTWLGELYRAERAGSYLRAVEEDIAAVPGLTERLGFAPARWERFIEKNRRVRGLWGKQTATYLGTAATFFGCAAIAVLLFWDLSSRMAADGTLVPPWGVWIWWLGIVLINGAGIWGAFRLYKRLMRLGEQSAPLHTL